MQTNARNACCEGGADADVLQIAANIALNFIDQILRIPALNGVADVLGGDLAQMVGQVPYQGLHLVVDAALPGGIVAQAAA